MRFLLIADGLPMPDRTSADFRLSRLLGMLAERAEVSYCVLGLPRQVQKIGTEASERYAAALADAGIRIFRNGPGEALRAAQYDAVMFEWHFPARHLLEEVRLRQPDARVLIDTVDVVFNRLEAKARLTGAQADIEKAATTRAVELALYAQCDLAITVTDADAEILRRIDPALATYTVPNTHPLLDPVPIPQQHDRGLVFVGSYARPGGETNIDAMTYFCRDVLPLIAAAEPEVKLRIVGGPAEAQIAALAGPNVEVMGFVPDTRPVLAASAISIAPLRFGGGMKGKVGEAMSMALPVVTTAFGIEGYGLTPGEHALVGDDPRSFADAVVLLLRDRELLERVRMAGWHFIRDHYSDSVVRGRVHRLLDELPGCPVKRAGLAPRLLHMAREQWERTLGWRLR